MTTDATPPEATESSFPQANSNTAGPNGTPSGNPNGPRQKQSFRRRRKRRGPGGNPAQAQGASQMQGQPQAIPNPSQSNPDQPNSVPQNAAPANGPRNDNQPRKQKKRFFKKSKNQQQGQNQGQNQGQGNNRAARADNRGNGQPQQRRGGKQRKQPKVFVGPMDHSYRAANGNYADAPPSTIELQRGYSNAHYNGNGNGNFNGNGNIRPLESMEASANPAPVENGPTRIYCFIDDLFFMAKIQETSRKLGIKVAFVKNEKDTIADLLALPEEERPTLIVFDLNNANAKPLTLIPKLKTKLKRGTSIVGFLSHLQGELKAKAIESGCDSVMPRSAFSQSLPNLLRRYGLDSEPELDDSQAIIVEA